MHYVKVKGILSARNGMNLYRGCTHGCIYCDSRSACYQMGHDFEDIEVKENGIELLEQALRRKRKKCMIGTGSMTDPYIPLEMELEHVRKALTLIARYGFGFTVITKSSRILRDMDLLQQINETAKCVIQMTLTTFDDGLCRKIEPKASVTSERYETLKRFRDAGIPTVVWLTPLLPFLNDTEENITGLLTMCADAGVRGIINFGMGVTLREGNREYFYKQLDKMFPGLKERYIRTYGNQYIVNSPRSKELSALFHETCAANGIAHDNGEIFEYLTAFETKEQQMSFF